MNFRTATTQDIPSLVNMRITFLVEDYGYITTQQNNLLQKSINSYFTTHLNKNTVAFIAEENNEIISTVILALTEKLPRIDSFSGKIGTLKNVYTQPAYRKKGIAKKLVLMAIAHAQQLHLDFLDLESTAQGLSMYEKLGFKLHHTHYTPMRLEMAKK